MIAKKLTICIPTYNRLAFLKKQINFIKSEVDENENLLQYINFIVCDNSSEDGTDVFLQKLELTHDFFDCHVNSENLGLIGNVVKLLSLSKTDFIWFLSDDDELEKGSLNSVISIISDNSSLNFIFLNFFVRGKRSFVPNTGLIANSKEVAIEIFNQSYGSLVLISSCVYKRENINNLKKHRFFSDLHSPLLYSFYCCSRGDIYISKMPLVNYRAGNASYAGLIRSVKYKFEGYVQILESSVDFGYGEKDVFSSIKKFMKNQSFSYVIYLFLNPRNAIYLVTTYFSLVEIILIPIYAIVNLFKACCAIFRSHYEMFKIREKEDHSM
jgi:glycosyltransferase involved in cell wall biosynthesis